MNEPIRILVVDDHPVVRDGLAAMLNTQSDFEVVGEASDGEEAVRKVADSDPDVLLLDLEMPGVDGIETLQRLRERKARARAIVFTVFDTDERIVSAMKAGAKGYLLKGRAQRRCVPCRAGGQRRRVVARAADRFKVPGQHQ